MNKVQIDQWAANYVDCAQTAESPIELSVSLALTPYLHERTLLIPQFLLNTKRGEFRADYMLVSGFGEKIVIECDGADFHDPVRDNFRDAFILASHCANYIYRFTGSDINRSTALVRYALYKHFNTIFSLEGEQQIAEDLRSVLGYDKVGPNRILPVPESFMLATKPNHFNGDWNDYHEIFNCQVKAGVNSRCARTFGHEYIAFAKANRGISLDDLVQRYKETHGIEEKSKASIFY